MTDKMNNDNKDNGTSKDVTSIRKDATSVRKDSAIRKDGTYKTRDGRPVRIYDILDEGPCPVHGTILNGDGEWFVMQWRRDGSSWCHTSHDLIEVKKVIYLKSMSQLLEEFPDAEFDDEGNLDSPSWTIEQVGFGTFLTPKEFMYLGKPVSLYFRETGYASIPPEWTEEREEP